MKSLLFTIVLSLLYAFTYSQDGLIGGMTINGVTTKFINGLPVINLPKHDSAMIFTSGVIGNSFYGNEYIGTAKADPAVGDWTPIDGFKRIHTGLLLDHYIRRLDGRGDDDVNFYIQPNAKDINLLNYLKKRPFINPFTGEIISNKSKITDWREIICETDVRDSQKKYFYPYLDNMPLKNQTILNTYGPFVHDGIDNAATGLLGDSHDYIEIHPVEQMWWVNTLNIGLGTTDEYNLFLLSDNSGRYNNQRWQKTPLPGVFAIAFTCNPKKDRIRINIEITNQLNVSHSSSDGKKHYFTYPTNQNTIDTLIEVNEPAGLDIMNVTFEDLYIEKNLPSRSMSGDDIIKGFIVIKTQVGYSENNNYDGNLLLKVFSTKLNEKWGLAGQNIIPTQVKVTLNKIIVVKSDDDNSTFSNENKEDIYGYIAAGAFDPTYKLPQALIKPVESIIPAKNNLLWFSLDDHDETELHLGTGQSKQLNVSRIFVVGNNGFIKLVANLDEDDSEYDDNSTTRDGDLAYGSLFTDPVDGLQAIFGTGSPDDLLEKDEYGYKKTDQEATFEVRNLVINRPVNKIFTFISGASKVEVHLTVQRIN